MRTTDLAMIFVAILLPIVVVVYVDVSFLLKKEEQTLYYINIINSAINDATYAMKNVESEENDIDYGYSGLSEKKISVNARVAIDTFFESLYDNFEITGDITSEEYIKSHIPVVAVVAYNGVYIYSMDEYINISTDQFNNEKYTAHVLKPKRYFTYTYAIDGNEILEDSAAIEKINSVTVEFTMDDYISVINKDGSKTSFYLEDMQNNSPLYESRPSMKDKIIQHLKLARLKVISEIVSEEMSYAVNSHNLYSDVKYEFAFPSIALSDWEDMINNVGIIAFIQGINIGNVNLDYVAHGISGLTITDRYYVSISDMEYYYHSTEECLEYKAGMKPLTGYYMNKIDAASAGYYPCPICKP